MKINLDQQFMDLRGNPLSHKMCDTLANALAISSTGNPKRVMQWAHDLINNGEIEVTAADVQLLRIFIMNSRLNNLERVQLLERIAKQTQAVEEKRWRLRIILR